MFVMVDVALQRIVQVGMDNLRANADAFNDIFGTYLEPEMGTDYGQGYIDKIREWFNTVKIPVVQSFSLNPTRMPCFSIHMASANEDESKAAMGDYFGDDDGTEVGTAVKTITINIGVHADKTGDYVLWMYYILTYILFKEKLMAERLGLRLQTFSASDFDKDSKYVAENVWSRWCRVKCTTQNFWDGSPATTLEEVKLRMKKGRVGDEDDEFSI